MYVTFEGEGMRVHAGVPQLRTMQDAVDGLIERAAEWPSSRPGYEIDIWCNEEGLLMRLPFLYEVRRGNAWIPIAGYLVITAHDGDGETVALVDDDISTITGIVRPIL